MKINYIQGKRQSGRTTQLVFRMSQFQGEKCLWYSKTERALTLLGANRILANKNNIYVFGRLEALRGYKVSHAFVDDADQYSPSELLNLVDLLRTMGAETATLVETSND